MNQLVEQVNLWKDVEHSLWPRDFHRDLCQAISDQMRCFDNSARNCLGALNLAPTKCARTHYRCRSFSTILGICHTAPTRLLGPLLHACQYSELVPSADLTGLAYLPNPSAPPYQRNRQMQATQVGVFFNAIASFMLKSRQCKLPIPHKHTSRATLWNLSSLADMTTLAAGKKISSIAGYLKKGPAFLNETKLESTGAMRAMLRLHGASVFDSPAVVKRDPRSAEQSAAGTTTMHSQRDWHPPGGLGLNATGSENKSNKHLSGGVAAIFPTDAYPESDEIYGHHSWLRHTRATGTSGRPHALGGCLLAATTRKRHAQNS